MTSQIKERVEDAVKDAMRARDKQRVGALRLVAAEFKKVEVDERVELDDARVLQILDKMVKQRRDSLEHYENAGRRDLAAQETFELELIAEFMPEGLSAAEIESIVDSVIGSVGAGSMKDMGTVMAALRPQVQGRADLGQVSALVKARLST